MSPSDGTLWVEPTQARSREKVDRILATAVQMMVETGSLDLKMTEVAKAAGVAVGTLYQFFPTRAALIGKLFAREMAPIDASLVEAVGDVTDMGELLAKLDALLRSHLKLVRTRPGLLV
ncbi:MAG: TetR/AcrR family transcriptional regulator, partial [Myxococcota bacterium]